MLPVLDFILHLQIIIKDKKAIGVWFVRDNKKHEIMANKEVIVSAGAVNSPQILMLSGIGPKEHLKSLGVLYNRTIEIRFIKNNKYTCNEKRQKGSTVRMLCEK